MSTQEKKICGIVMPISALDGCSEGHWSDVLEIVTEAVEAAGFEGNMVSNADDVGIIQKRIIQNLYENPIVVCDVSGKNPNVMFELGMRLAFDKPTIIIKDDKTTYSFDTSPIEHLEYPRDLRFSRIVDFKSKLAEKIKATYEKFTADPQYTTFLKHFGEFKVAKIDKKEVTGQEFIIEELRSIRQGMRRLERSYFSRDVPSRESKGMSFSENEIDMCMASTSATELQKLKDLISACPGVLHTKITELDSDHRHFLATVSDAKVKEQVLNILRNDPNLGKRRHHPVGESN